MPPPQLVVVSVGGKRERRAAAQRRLLLLQCPHCDRLYSRHSIALHEPKCRSKPQQRRSTIVVSSSSSTSTTLVRRRTSTPKIVDTSRHVVDKPLDDDTTRPTTCTISRSNESLPSNDEPRRRRRPTPRHSRRASLSDEPTRTCFVCSARMAASELADHAADCESRWRARRVALPDHLEMVASPRQMPIPSVDGEC